jgi:hypothetical protein
MEACANLRSDISSILMWLQAAPYTFMTGFCAPDGLQWMRGQPPHQAGASLLIKLGPCPLDDMTMKWSYQELCLKSFIENQFMKAKATVVGIMAAQLCQKKISVLHSIQQRRINRHTNKTIALQQPADPSRMKAHPRSNCKLP